jgi:cell cycle arrest protein BUB3
MPDPYELPDSPKDSISSAEFCPTSASKLLVASWDKHVYLYDIESKSLLNKFELRAAVLDACFGQDDKEAFVGGLDWDLRRYKHCGTLLKPCINIRRIDLETGEQTVISEHQKPVKAVAYSRENSLLISGSWDKTLHVHLMNQPSRIPSTVLAIQLPDDVFSLSLSPTKVVVAMKDRGVQIFNLDDLLSLCSSSPEGTPTKPTVVPPENITPWQVRESSMKFQIRTVSCMPNDSGYAASSIEGRIAVEWFDPSPESQSRKYAFKCHRHPDPEDKTVEIVYPVNQLAWHPIHGTFASGGGDGVLAMWDGVAKRRIKQYQKLSQSVEAMAFSPDGKYIAIGISPLIKDGTDFDALAQDNVDKCKIFIRELSEDEGKSKGKK